MSSAFADVQTNKVAVEMRVMAEDFVLYNNLKAGEDFLYPAEQLRSAAKQHREFLLKNFFIRDYDGEKLEGEIVSMDTSDLPEEGVYAAELMSFAVTYNMEYPLDEPPEYLSFAHEFGGEGDALPAVMDLVVFQSGVWTEDAVQLGAGQPHIMEFDWSEPPRPVPRSWQARKRAREQRQKEMLGITSYSSVYSYFYITEREVRLEILIPLLTLKTWFPIEQADPDFLEIEEQEAARERIREYFSENNTVEIDGIVVKPALKRADFYGLDFRDFAQQAPERRVSTYNARVGIILSYSTKGTPQTVKLTWEEFNEHTPYLKSTIYVFNEPGFQQFLVPDEPVFEWTNEGAREIASLAEVPPPPPVATWTVPVLSVGLFIAGAVAGIAGFTWAGKRSNGITLSGCFFLVLGALTLPFVRMEIDDPFASRKPVTEEQAQAIFAALHKNIYRAFDYGTESDTYDVLAQSVSGDLLSDLYLQILRGLKMSEQGGATSRVTDVSILEGRRLPPSGERASRPGRNFDYECVWTVEGTVEHWGHVHTRKNQYQATFQVAALDNGWKITDFEVRSEKRVNFETGLRNVK